MKLKLRCGPYCVGLLQTHKWDLYRRYGLGGLSELHVAVWVWCSRLKLDHT